MILWHRRSSEVGRRFDETPAAFDQKNAHFLKRLGAKELPNSSKIGHWQPDHPHRLHNRCISKESMASERILSAVEHLHCPFSGARGANFRFENKCYSCRPATTPPTSIGTAVRISISPSPYRRTIPAIPNVWHWTQRISAGI